MADLRMGGEMMAPTRMAGLLPRGRLVVVPGEPHGVHYTRPRLVARIMSELLAEEGDEIGRAALPGARA